MFNKFFEGSDKKQVISWGLVDFGNSAFSLLILSFVFPIYFKEVIAAGRAGDFWWGFAVSVSVLIAGVLSPIIGAMADYDTKRKAKFILFSILSIIGTAALYFTGEGMLLFAIFLFILTTIFFEIAQTLYDSFLVQISNEKNAGRISGFAWGLGYLGGAIALLLFAPLFSKGYSAGLENSYKLTFPLTALFFFIFALPCFFFIKEQGVNIKGSFLKLVRTGIRNTYTTIKEIKKYKKIAFFLLGFYLLADALVTLFAFIPIYAKTTLGLNFSEIAVLLLIVYLIGFPSTILFGWLSDKKGQRNILLSTLVMWCLIVVLIAASKSKISFYVASVLTGLAIGSSQSIARSWYSQIIPKEKRSEFFGFNGFASKVAATTGPLVFGIISTLTSNQRIAMLSLIPYFILSFV